MQNKIKNLEEKLLRKEKECERLKHDNDYEVGALEKTIDNLKAECDDWRNRSDEWMSKCEQETKLREFVDEQLDQLKAENGQLKKELSAIHHNCNREGCRYYDDNTFKVFYGCKAQKALQLSANSVTTKYCDLLKALTEIKEIAEYCYDPVDKENDGFWTILQLISEVEL